MQTELTKDQIRALLEVAPKDDSRFYLNGACLDADRGLVVATDGHILLAIRVHIEGTGQAILDRDTLDKARRAFGRKGGSARIEIDGQVCWVHVNGEPFPGQLIDGTYPDYAQVVPTEPSGELAQFNGALLGRLSKAFERLGGVEGLIEVAHNGTRAALVAHYSVPEAIACVMPFRPSRELNAAKRARELLHGDRQAAA